MAATINNKSDRFFSSILWWSGFTAFLCSLVLILELAILIASFDYTLNGDQRQYSTPTYPIVEWEWNDLLAFFNDGIVSGDIVSWAIYITFILTIPMFSITSHMALRMDPQGLDSWRKAGGVHSGRRGRGISEFIFGDQSKPIKAYQLLPMVKKRVTYLIILLLVIRLSLQETHWLLYTTGNYFDVSIFILLFVQLSIFVAGLVYFVYFCLIGAFNVWDITFMPSKLFIPWYIMFGVILFLLLIFNTLAQFAYPDMLIITHSYICLSLISGWLSAR